MKQPTLAVHSDGDCVRLVNTAVFSPDRTYRYELWRRWGVGRDYCCFIGLNPSTADEIQDDPTIRRCIGFAKELGYGSLCMLNLFAFRSRFPDVMKMQPDPVGPDNDATIQLLAHNAGIVVAAWGVHGTHIGRAGQVLQMIPNLHCLGTTKQGHPKHPLYLPKYTKPVPMVKGQDR